MIYFEFKFYSLRQLGRRISEYYKITRNHFLSILFVTPLWLLYEFLAFKINNGWYGNLRTGIDFLIKKGLSHLNVPVEFLLVLLLSFLGFFLFKNIQKFRLLNVRAAYFVFMFLESLFYAVLFGLVVGGLTSLFLHLQTITFDSSKVASIVINLGSGIYEEFFFRLLLVSGIAVVLRKRISKNTSLVYLIAVLASSLFFALFHHLNVFNEPFEIKFFLFRFFAGVALAILFIFRGYGISAYTHSLYNILLLLR